MNGRAYDYNLGRFLSVDPFIQAPGNSQSMNPYSYIMNNPLAGTDPSGYVACEDESECVSQEVEEGDKFLKDKDGNIYHDKGGDTLVKVDSISVKGSVTNGAVTTSYSFNMNSSGSFNGEITSIEGESSKSFNFSGNINRKDFGAKM